MAAGGSLGPLSLAELAAPQPAAQHTPHAAPSGASTTERSERSTERSEPPERSDADRRELPDLTRHRAEISWHRFAACAAIQRAIFPV